jgi:hypothetical protein
MRGEYNEVKYVNIYAEEKQSAHNSCVAILASEVLHEVSSNTIFNISLLGSVLDIGLEQDRGDIDSA